MHWLHVTVLCPSLSWDLSSTCVSHPTDTIRNCDLDYWVMQLFLACHVWVFFPPFFWESLAKASVQTFHINLPWKDVHCTSHMIYFDWFQQSNVLNVADFCLSETLGLLYLLNVKFQHWLLAFSYSWGAFPAAGREVWWGFFMTEYILSTWVSQCAENVHLCLEEVLCWPTDGGE